MKISAGQIVVLNCTCFCLLTMHNGRFVQRNTHCDSAFDYEQTQDTHRCLFVSRSYTLGILYASSVAGTQNLTERM